MDALSFTAAPHLRALHDRLEEVDGVSAGFVSQSEIIIAFKGRPIGKWTPDGGNLTGAFACEAVLLCAGTVDEAYQLTIGRLA